MNKKTALVLSGGGAKGAFQFAAEKYAREVKGYRWRFRWGSQRNDSGNGEI